MFKGVFLKACFGLVAVATLAAAAYVVVDDGESPALSGRALTENAVSGNPGIAAMPEAGASTARKTPGDSGVTGSSAQATRSLNVPQRKFAEKRAAEKRVSEKNSLAKKGKVQSQTENDDWDAESELYGAESPQLAAYVEDERSFLNLAYQQALLEDPQLASEIQRELDALDAEAASDVFEPEPLPESGVEQAEAEIDELAAEDGEPPKDVDFPWCLNRPPLKPETFRCPCPSDPGYRPYWREHMDPSIATKAGC